MTDSSSNVESIVELIRQLTPAQRRTLIRRLQVSGLLQTGEINMDRRRMSVAPALGPAMTRAARPSAGAQPIEPPPPVQPERPRTPLRMATPRNADDQAAISGHVVLGAPRGVESAPAPHQMAPLPGQAPEEPIVIVLRGLAFPNGEAAAAEYMLSWPGFSPQAVQVRFAGRPTPEQALYDTLEKALRVVLGRLRDSQADATTARVEVFCPSDDFIDELIGEKPVADARLQTRHDRVSELLDGFGEWRLLRTGE